LHPHPALRADLSRAAGELLSSLKRGIKGLYHHVSAAH
jgi:hypothetical protein